MCSGICGDGIIVLGESCDDSGTTPGDGCDASCEVEQGFVCGGEPSVCFVLAPALWGPWAVLLGICLLGFGARVLEKVRVNRR